MEENNKLIAEFIGYKIENKKFQSLEFHSSNESSWEWNEGEIVTLNGNEVSDPSQEPYFSLEDLPFDSDWNYLMEVVEKIENLKDSYHGRFGVYISSNSCTIQSTNFRPDKPIPNPPHYYDNIVLNTKIESTYYSVLNFINFYNKQKEK